jgi:hypothetical protein
LKFDELNFMMQNQQVRTKTSRNNRPANPQNREARLQQQQPKANKPKQKQMVWRPVSDKPVQTKFTNRNVKRSNLSSNFGSRNDVKRLPVFTEQVSQPLSSAAWALFQSYSLNPGQAVYFPVGSVECQQWQKYRFRSFRVIYEPIVNEYNTNNDGAGEIIIGFDPDASDQAPTTYAQAVNMKPVARGRPCDKIVLVIPQHLLKGQNDAHFVRHAGLPGGSDIKTYDVGLINISVVGSGTTGSTVLGNIFFEYELDLLSQQIALTTNSPANNAVSFFNSTGPETNTTTVPLQVLFATTKANGLNIINTAGSFVPPPGNYLVDATAAIEDTAAEAIAAQFIVKKNGTQVQQQYKGISNQGATGGGAGQEYMLIQSVFVSCNGTDAITITSLIDGAAGTLTTVGTVRFTAI